MKLVFIHIPKTSGSSFRKYLKMLDTVCRVRMGEFDLINHDCNIFAGHLFYEHVRHEFPGARFVTVLREPLQRVISHYRHVIKAENHYLHADCKDMSLGRFINHPLVQPVICNLQTKYLAGFPLYDSINRAEYVTIADNTVDIAIENLKTFFHFGVQDQQEQLVHGLLSKLELPISKVYQRKTENYKKTTSMRDRQIIRGLNLQDYKLYNFAKAQLK